MALGSGIVAAVAALFGGVATVFGIAEVVGLFVDLQRASRRAITLSGGWLFTGTLLGECSEPIW